MSASGSILPGSSGSPSGISPPDSSKPSGEGVRQLDDVERKLPDDNECEWDQRIMLQGLPVIPVTLPPDFSLSRPSEEQETGGLRKRKASAIRLLSRYWDNCAELHQFGPEAEWLFKRLTTSLLETRMVIPEGVRFTGKHRSLASAKSWEGIVEHWLSMDGKQRASTLEHNLQHILLPEDDPRQGLRGQSGVVAARDIDAFTVLGPYAGKYCLGRDQREEVAEYGANVGRYAVDCSMDAVRLDVCGYGYGNVTVCINANTTYRPGQPVYNANAFFVMVVYQGWPYIFVVSSQSIAKGQEILVDYGRYYWLGY